MNKIGCLNCLWYKPNPRIHSTPICVEPNGKCIFKPKYVKEI